MLNAIKKIAVVSMYATTGLFTVGLVLGSFPAYHVSAGSSNATDYTLGNVAQNNLEYTAGSLDVAIAGPGFFQVKLPWTIGGTGYTRNGSLMLNHNGDLIVCIHDGYELMPPINIPYGAKDVVFKPEGTVEYTDPSTARNVVVGSLQLCKFANPKALKAEGSGIFTQTDASGPAIIVNPGENGAGEIRHRFLETRSIDSSQDLANAQ